MRSVEARTAEIVAQATSPKPPPGVVRPTVAEVQALLDSIADEPGGDLVRASRVGSELAPMLARLDALTRSAMVSVVSTQYKFVAKKILEAEVTRIAKALEPPPEPKARGNSGDDDTEGPDGLEPYRIHNGGFERLSRTRDGVPTYTRISDFSCRIVRQIDVDHGGDEPSVFLEFAGQTSGGVDLPPVRVQAKEWPGMRWLTTAWGGLPRWSASSGSERHLRAAIQHLSGEDYPRVQVRGYTGWTVLNGQWFYLHAGGAIGANGNDPSWRVDLGPNLAGYTLPDPPQGEARIRAIRASLAFLTCAPLPTTVPLFLACWRAVLPIAVDYAMMLVGRSNAGKSELAARIQQHWGAGWERKRLPGNWVSTINSIEADAYAIQHAIYTLDDLVTSPDRRERAESDKAFERLARSIGNQAGRGRLNADSTAKAAKPPRGLVLITAEDVPHARQSAVGRCMLVEMPRDSMDWPQLQLVREAGNRGLLAGAMAAYAQWLAPDLETYRADYAQAHMELRDEIDALGVESLQRTKWLTADLLVGLQLFCAFAVDSGALDQEQADLLMATCRDTMIELARDQGAEQAERDPVRQYLSTLRSMLMTGRAHVLTVHGGCPAESPDAWGWRVRASGAGFGQTTDWEAKGPQIGWVNEKERTLYLIPQESYSAVQKISQDAGNGLAIGFKRLGSALKEAGILVTTDETRKTTMTRRRVGGQVVEIWLIGLETLNVSDSENGSDTENQEILHGISQELVNQIKELVVVVSDLSDMSDSAAYAHAHEAPSEIKARDLPCTQGGSPLVDPTNPTNPTRMGLSQNETFVDVPAQESAGVVLPEDEEDVPW